MSICLLDSSVLIALSVAEHEHFARCEAWIASQHRFALCPITEGALVRQILRLGDNTADALNILRHLHADDRCAFWPDSVSYVDADLGHVRGHRQVTDAYLVALARENEARLATLDRALAAAVPDTAFLVPH